MKRSSCAVLLLSAAVLSLAACGTGAEAWKSPAEAAAFAALERKTLEPGLSKKRRAQLFFLWGQELAAQARSGQAASSSATGASADSAIAAFETVVDLNSILVDESRYNLELLWKDRSQSGESKDQNQQGKQGKQGGKDQQAGQNQQSQGNDKSQQNRQDGKDQPNGQDKQPPRDKQNGNGQPGNQDATQDAAKDLSAFVRDKEQSQDVESALKAEMERLKLDKDGRAETGSAAPVEKDW